MALTGPDDTIYIKCTVGVVEAITDGVQCSNALTTE
jgi:hypothetical protein